MDGNEELQLLPGTKKRLGIKVPGENRFLYIGSAILGATIVTAFWFNFNNNSLQDQITGLDEQLFTLEQQRDEKGEENIRTIRQQIELTTELINQHIYPTRAFDKLGSLLQENIQVENMSYEATASKLNIAGIAGSYTTIARQIASLLSDDSVKDVSVGKMEPDPNGTVKFSMAVLYDSAKLLKIEKKNEGN